MKIVYVGPYEDGVEFVDRSGRAYLALPGDPIEVPKELGESLLEQPSNWQLAPTPKPDTKETSK